MSGLYIFLIRIVFQFHNRSDLELEFNQTGYISILRKFLIA